MGKTIKKNKEKPLKVSGSFSDVIRVAVRSNPKPAKKLKRK